MTCPTPAAPIAATMFFARRLLSMRTWLETERGRKKNVRSLGATQCALKGRTRMGEHWTKLPMILTWDDICWIWSKRASSTSIVASMFRLAVIPFHLVQQSGRNVA